MNSELIVMLTRNDVTVEDAMSLFLTSKDLPIAHWGFKDIGLSGPAIKDLVGAMKSAGKTTYLEVVSLSEEDGLKGAELAVESGFDVLMGTVFYPSIQSILAGSHTRYFPFAGRVHGHPSILDGSCQEVVNHARELQEAGVAGIDLLSYRFTGDPVELLHSVVEHLSIPVVSAGSIDSFDRIREVEKTHAWAFTIGSAFFNGSFEPGGTFQDNLRVVTDWLARGDA